MTGPHDENYWSTRFEVTEADLNAIAQRLEHKGTPEELKEIALHIIRARLERGSDSDTTRPAEDILLDDGARILGRLTDVLQSDPRFIGLAGTWFLADQLPPIERAALQKVHRLLIQDPSASEEEILSAVNDNESMDKTLLRLALHAALRRSSERFENIGTSAHPHWQARLPAFEQAQVTEYAYDPETYEILCRPGQRLSEKKAQRLQELKLYAQVVTFAE